jgi:uncharacterized OB-fold protein
MARGDEKGKDNDRDLVLEEMKELEKELDMKVRECPKCASFVPPDEKRCQSCGYYMTSLDDEEIDAAENGKPKVISAEQIEVKKKIERDSKNDLEEEDGLGSVLEEMEELVSEEDETEEEESEENFEDDEEIPESEMEEKPERDIGKMMSFIVIIIGVATYIATPFVVSDAGIAALALILGAFIIVIGGNMAYSSLQSATFPEEKDAAAEPSGEDSGEAEEEEVEEEKDEDEVDSDEEEDRVAKEEDEQAESESEKVEDARPENDKTEGVAKDEEIKDDDSQYVELIPMADSKVDHFKGTHKCPVCKHTLEPGATECPKCGALFDE